MTAGFSTIHFYIILKRMSLFMISGYVSVPYIFTSFSNITPGIWWQSQFQYHTFLHHSQTNLATKFAPITVSVPYIFTSFSNGLLIWNVAPFVSVPYIFTSFSNQIQRRRKKQDVSVPYIFTSFSNY